MKVLHVIDKLSMDGINPSSCTILFGGWAQSFSEAGCEMAVLTLGNEHEVGAYLRERGIEDCYSNASKFSLAHVEKIRSLVEERGFSLVHLHGYGAAHFGRLASRRAGVPNIVHEHAVLKAKPHHCAIDWLLRHKTDAAIAVSEYVKAFMMRVRSVPEDRIRVIGNGVDLSRFKVTSTDQKQRIREQLGIPADAKVVGTVTRFREEKGNEFLIRSFRRVHDQHPNARLALVGDGPLRERLLAIASEEGIADSVHWLGFRSDVETVLTIFDVHVIPSLTEGFPLALAEGMAVGNPMVVTAVGGMLELAVDGENALLVPPSNASAISEATLRLLNDDRLEANLRSNAIRSAQAMSISRSAQAVLRLYDEMTQRFAPPNSTA